MKIRIFIIFKAVVVLTIERLRGKTCSGRWVVL